MRFAAIVLVVGAVAAGCGAPPAAVVSPTPTIRYTPEPTATPSPTRPPTPSPTPSWTGVPPVAEDVAGVAKQLATVEATLRDPSVSGIQLTYYGHFEQLLVSTINDNPTWQRQVVDSLPEAHRRAVNGTIEAGRALRGVRGPTPKTLPEWKIVEPAPMPELLGYYREAEQRFGVPWYYLAAINLVETRMGRIRGLSYAGAQGPMQFIPSTWAAYGLGGNIEDPHDAILGAANYLKANGAPGDMDRALFRYNNSDAYVRAIQGYADVMKNDPEAFRGYHGWQVYYTTVDGTSWLQPGWTKAP